MVTASVRRTPGCPWVPLAGRGPALLDRALVRHDPPPFAALGLLAGSPERFREGVRP